jgi:hypothetical protein
MSFSEGNLVWAVVLLVVVTPNGIRVLESLTGVSVPDVVLSDLSVVAMGSRREETCNMLFISNSSFFNHRR